MKSKILSFLSLLVMMIVSTSAWAKTVAPSSPGSSVSALSDPSDAKLLWDYTDAAPAAKPDNGLYYEANVNDGTGTNNGLRGIKMNSSGYAYFTKEAVKGTLKLTFGPRKGSSNSSLAVYTFTKDGGTVTKGDKIATTDVVTELSTQSIELTAEQNNIYIAREAAVEQVLTKIEFVPFVERSFKDFEMVLGSLPAEFDASTLPTGVTLSGTYNSDTHGYRNAVITVPVDGTVKFTYSSCSYGNQKFSIKDANDNVVASDLVLTLGDNTCYHQSASNVLTYLYTGEPTTLTFGPIQYLAYFKAEACEVAPCTVTFKDQNGTVISTKETFEGEVLGDLPSAESVTVPTGSAFRGWVYASGAKAKATDLLSGNTTITARVTPIETVEAGSVQNYNLESNIFYPEDHETITIEGGSYYNTHGWSMNANGTISVDVAGNAQVVLKLCEYGNGTTITVTDGNGDVVATDVPAKAGSGSDGAKYTFNYEGEATTLTLTFAAQSYIHAVTVYNVNEFVKKDEKTGWYIVPAGDGAAFLLALNSANSEEGSTIFLPNGTYDLGETTSTTISAKNMSIIGESMEGTIIKNAPNVKMEGLGKADLFYNTSTGLYMQDLTIQNDLDYYGAGAAGRAAVLQDNGKQTILRNVAMRSYQDTYYSKSGDYYFEGGLIQGTVDYMCGGGNAWFENITLLNKSRSESGNTGDDTMSAYNGTGKYIFNNCSVESECATFNFGRSWADAYVVYLNTTIKSGKLADSRFSTADMNSKPRFFGEYNTVDLSGNGKNTPASNRIKTSLGGDFESVLTAEQAEAYTLESLFGSWDPKTIAAQAVADASDIDADAAYLVENNGEFVAIIKGSEFDASTYAGMTIRKANAKGGFGEPVVVEELVNTLLTAGNYKIDATITPKEGITVPEALTKYLGGYTAKGTMTGDEKELVIASEEGLLNGYSVKGDAVILKADATVTIEGKTFQVATAEGNTTGKLAITDNGDGSYGVAEAAVIYNNVVVGTVSGMKVYPYKDFEAGTYYLKSVEYDKFFTRGTHDATAWGSHAAVNKYGIPVKFVDNGSGSMIMYAADIYYESADHSIYINNDYCDNGTKGSYEVTYDYSKDAFAIANKNGGYVKAFENDYVDTGAAEPSYWTLVSGEEYEDFLAEDEAATKAAVLAAANVTEEEFATYVTMDVSESYDAKPANGNAWALNKISTRNNSYFNYGTYGAEIYMGYGTYTQTIEDLKPGIYRVNVAALYRSTFAKALKPLAAEGFKSVSDATVTINSSVAQIAPWYTGQEGDNDVPNTTGEFVDNVDKYTKPVLAYVGEDGNMTISVETTSWWWGAWLLFNSIDIVQMVDEHTAADTVQATENAEKQINKYVENGRLVIVDANGMKYNAAGQIVK